MWNWKNSISQRIYSTDQVRGQVDDLRSNLEFFQKSQISSKTDKSWWKLDVNHDLNIYRGAYDPIMAILADWSLK